ncbi:MULTISPECIES: hypothetical protein [unclassified Nostoc]|uniref:hypothetical protein n=1 Tax=unclassified Nostoc TaxID=2593658 RepID=UPI0018F0517F|nr:MULTISPECIES: hypothetical protein [unclassified Nostoc]
MDYLPLTQQITFLYTHDLITSTLFYEEKLGLKLWLDQGSCRIYSVCGDAYLGLCQIELASVSASQKQPNVIFTLVTQQVDE